MNFIYLDHDYIIVNGTLFLWNIEKAALLASDDDDDEEIVKMNSQSTPKLTQIQGQVKEVIGDMRINLEKVIDRGQNLHELNDRSEQLMVSGDLFSKRARSVRKTMWLRTCRSRLYLAIAITLVLIMFTCKLCYNSIRLLLESLLIFLLLLLVFIYQRFKS